MRAILAHGAIALLLLLALPLVYGPSLASNQERAVTCSRVRKHWADAVGQLTLGGSLATVFWAFAAIRNLQGDLTRGIVFLGIGACAVVVLNAAVLIYGYRRGYGRA